MGWLNGTVTLLGLLFFVGVVWWAFSKGRQNANAEAAMLPFALPDEGAVYEKNRTELRTRHE